jgi:hypothetical protein
LAFNAAINPFLACSMVLSSNASAKPTTGTLLLLVQALKKNIYANS